MKRLILITIVCAFVAAPAFADSSIGDVSRIRLQTYSWPYQSGSGGEFRATVIANVADGINYNDVYIPVGGQFTSFCVEEEETVSGSDTNYWVVVNSSAVKGGVAPLPGAGGYVGGNPLYNPLLDPLNTGTDSKGQANFGDPLDPKTAYLFTQFSQGTLSGYRYSGTHNERTADAAALQNAIWYIEQEIATLPSGKATTWYNAAVAAGWTSIGSVRVLNLYTTYNATTGKVTGLAQDILVIPVPAAVLLGMLGLGVAGLKLRRFA